MNNLRKQYSFLKKVSVWFGSSSIIVLTMGKVGTLTICNSLDKIGIKHVHPHSLRYTRPGVHFLKNIDLSVLKKLYYFYKTLTKRIKVYFWLKLSKEVRVITGVRDPFSRSLSAFIEQSHYIGLVPEEISFTKLHDSFLKHYDLNGTIAWFDEEVKRVFGVDVYDTCFDKDNGYQVINNGKFKIFIYRIDFLSKLDIQLQEFLGEKKFKLLTTNVTSENKSYKELRNKVKFTKNDINLIKESKFMRHFYDKNEVDFLCLKWSEN